MNTFFIHVFITVRARGAMQLFRIPIIINITRVCSWSSEIDKTTSNKVLPVALYGVKCLRDH